MKFESTLYSFHAVDYKLRKLSEHIITIQNLFKDNTQIFKDLHYFSSIYQYIEHALEIILIKDSNLNLLKKILSNIEVNIN